MRISPGCKFSHLKENKGRRGDTHGKRLPQKPVSGTHWSIAKGCCQSSSGLTVRNVSS